MAHSEKTIHYSVDFDKSKSNGSLHFTHELTLYFIHLPGYKIEFAHADVLNPGGWDTYLESEKSLLENDYPGIIEEAKKILIAEQNLKEEDFA